MASVYQRSTIGVLLDQAGRSFNITLAVQITGHFAGCHLHFLDDTRTRGGHMLDYELSEGTVELMELTEIHLSNSSPVAESHAINKLTACQLQIPMPGTAESVQPFSP